MFIIKRGNMKKLSLCMIVKNEAKTLDRALKNAYVYADEIIVVDTGSTDGTKEIALKYTDKVFDYKWKDDFSDARNFSFDKAEYEYIMWLDGDDFLPDNVAHKIRDWKFSGSDEDVLMCVYATAYNDNLEPTYQFLRERIVKNLPFLRWHDKVHEVIIPYGEVVNNLDIIIYHGKQKPHTNRNLKIYRKMIKNKEKFSPRAMFYYARELFYNGYYKSAISKLNQFLKLKDAFVINKIDACLIKCNCYERLGQSENALESLFETFEISFPRGEVLYEIGKIFLAQGKYKEAIYWLERAFESEDNLESYAFVDKNKTSLFPALDLIVCFYNQGDLVKARHYHEVTKTIDPQNEIVLYNDLFFNSLG